MKKTFPLRGNLARLMCEFVGFAHRRHIQFERNDNGDQQNYPAPKRSTHMRSKIAVAGVLLVGFAQGSFASTITNGNFDIAGTVYVTAAEATPVVTPAGTCAANIQCIFWQDSAGTLNQKADISNTLLPNGDIPLALFGNDAANIFDLTNPPEVVGTVFTPLTFMTFNNAGVTTDLMLNLIKAGIDPSTLCGSSIASAAAGQLCTLPGSLFNFQNTSATSSSVTWNLAGITNTPGVTWTGSFGTTFVTKSFQQVFADLSTNGFVQSTFQANFNLTTAPEPGPMVLMGSGIGLLLMGVALRKRFHRQS
jgi:hypothetical protein